MTAGVCGDLRQLVRESPNSLNEICRRSGVSRATLARLLRGQGVGRASLEKLARELGYTLAVTLRRDHETVGDRTEVSL